MNNKNKTFFSIIVIILSSIVIGFVIKYYVEENNNEKYLKNNGDIIKGVVVERKNYGRYTTYITCRYIVKGQELLIKKRVNKFEYVNDVEIEIGDTLNVFVEPRKPKNSFIDLESIIYDSKK